jgi:hypothetical protein
VLAFLLIRNCLIHALVTGVAATDGAPAVPPVDHAKALALVEGIATNDLLTEALAQAGLTIPTSGIWAWLIANWKTILPIILGLLPILIPLL